jgi:hypothetical protein
MNKKRMGILVPAGNQIITEQMIKKVQGSWRGENDCLRDFTVDIDQAYMVYFTVEEVAKAHPDMVIEVVIYHTCREGFWEPDIKLEVIKDKVRGRGN